MLPGPLAYGKAAVYYEMPVHTKQNTLPRQKAEFSKVKACDI